MHTVVMQNHLEKGLSAISRIVSAKAQLPILANILLHAQKGELLLGATNLNESIKLSIPTKVEEEGDLTVPGRLLTEFVHLLPNKPVTLSTKNQSLQVVCENAQGDFAGIAATEFPHLPETDAAALFQLSTDVLQQITTYVTFAASKDEARPHLTGVLIKLSERGMQCIATDGFRLSVLDIPQPMFSQEQLLLLPAKSFEELGRLAKDFSREKTDTVAVSLLPEQNQVVAKIGLLEYSTRLIEGKFPDWERVVPQEFETTVVISREELLSAVRLASVFSRETISVIKMIVATDGVTVTSDAKEVGSNVVHIDAEVDGVGGEIAFNPRFLLELLQSIDVPTIEMAMAGPHTAAVFRKIPNDNFLHVIMPVRV